MANKKIFVGGLSWDTTAESLKSYFENFGAVKDCTLKTNPTTGKSRGFGFVEFDDPSSVSAILSQPSHSLDGKNIDPKPAKALGGREPVLKVFVGGLDPSTTEDEIRQHFQQYGAVDEIDLPFDKVKNQRRAFCFVKFQSEDVVDQVTASRKQNINGKEVDVKKATPKDQGGFGGAAGGFAGGRGGRGGGRGGRGGYGGYGGQQGYGGYESGYGGSGSYGQSNYYSNGSGYGGDYSNGYSGGYGGYGAGAGDEAGYGGSYGGYGSGQQSFGSSGGARGYGSGAANQQQTTTRSYHPYQR